ncbi:MAG: ATP phosphoribosyltransferase regulatory subunit [Cryobacterium sp.]|nr:ATP phosphoribosyltransferase regulatory subunit [Cryobacterium sp.]
MRDFLPAEKARRERVLSVIRDTYRAHGFEEIETPAVEDSSRLHAGLGGDNEKLAFGILKRGLTAEDLAAAKDPLELADLGLRFDLTVPLTRFYASHRAELPAVFRSIQLGSVWRAERPQKGRYRQFMQCDIDVIGDATGLADAELIVASLATFDALGLEGVTMRVNDRRILTALLNHLGFPESTHPSVLITLDKLDKIGPDGVVAELAASASGQDAVAALRAYLTRPQTMEFNPYGERQIRKALPDDFDSPVVAELIALGEAVAGAIGERAESGIPLTFDPFLVRGMGYYTGVIVEAMHPGEGYSLGGGGRYDGMIGRFLGTDVPASGFSIGFERIVDLVSLREVEAADAVALLFDEGADPARLVALKAELIASGTRVRLERAPRNVKALLDSLAASGYGRFAHVGDAETAAELSFKPLTTGS